MPGTFAEAPKVRQYLIRNAATLIRYSNYHMLRGFADQDLDGRRASAIKLSLLDQGLYRVPQELTNDVLQVALNVRKSCIKVTVDADFRNLHMRSISGLDQVLRSLSASLDNLLCIAFEKDLADSVAMGVVDWLGVWEMPWRVESICEG